MSGGKEMGWKSDWLYQMILEKFSAPFDNAHRRDPNAFPKVNGSPPEEVIVSEYPRIGIESAENHRKRYLMRGNPIRFLRYSHEGWEQLSTFDYVPPEDPRPGMYYQRAGGGFAISQDRKIVVIQYQFGPRYGLHATWSVEGQNRTGRFVLKDDAEGWIS